MPRARLIERRSNSQCHLSANRFVKSLAEYCSASSRVVTITIVFACDTRPANCHADLAHFHLLGQRLPFLLAVVPRGVVFGFLPHHHMVARSQSCDRGGNRNAATASCRTRRLRPEPSARQCPGKQSYSRSPSTISPGCNVSQICRNKLCSPVFLPRHPPTAHSNTVPTDNDKNTTKRRIGKPSPAFWFRLCGYSAWLAGVSSMVAVEPSTSVTRRPFHNQPVLGLPMQFLPGFPRQVAQNLFGQSPSRRTIAGGVRRTGLPSLLRAVGQHAADRILAGRVLSGRDLRQKGPQRHQGRVNPLAKRYPGTLQGRLEALLVQQLPKRQPLIDAPAFHTPTGRDSTPIPWYDRPSVASFALRVIWYISPRVSQRRPLFVYINTPQ